VPGVDEDLVLTRFEVLREPGGQAPALGVTVLTMLRRSGEGDSLLYSRGPSMKLRYSGRVIHAS